MLKIQINRRKEIHSRTGFSNSTLHSRIKDEVFPPPIPLGERAVGWLEHEVNAVLAAMAEGRGKAELKALVIQLVEARKQLSKVEAAE